MKFVILSDIHGNIFALEECLKYIDNMEFDAIIWCGDYITDIPKCHEVIDVIRAYSKKYKSYIVRGNRENYILEYANNKHPEWKINTRQENIVFTYNSLTKEDIEWISCLPETLEINTKYGKIYISHKCTYENIDKCRYKIFGHSHKQCKYMKDGVKYINPGSVGVPLLNIVGTQFSILEITNEYEKVEEYCIKYDIQKPIDLIKEFKMDTKGYRWGKPLIKTIETGKDYTDICINNYNRIRNEQNINEESLEIWNTVLNNI